MKVVILAAGMGTRLGTLIPKPLTPLINEKNILYFQIEKLKKYFSIHDIFIVVGYKKELIMESFPNLVFIYNHDYTQNNTGKSLLYALEKLDDDVLWVNGDVYFDSGVIDLMLKSNYSCCLVDTKKCGEEEIKYTLNKEGNIISLSKTIKNGIGEALGINLIKRRDLELFREELRKIGKNEYYERALENLARENKIILKPINKGSYFCQEIDFPEDLERVKNYIKSKVQK